MKRLAIMLVLGLLGAAPVPGVDLILRGGTIYTGDEAPFVGDVAVRGERIVRVARRISLPATRTIDVTGMIVAPGFIDPHTHVGGMIASDGATERLVLPFLMQGVTTAFIGNDGSGRAEVGSILTNGGKQVGINFASYVGFGSVREAVVGKDNRAPTPEEIAAMQRLVDRAMCEGAMGLSTGLFYSPQSFATTDEVVAVARAAARRGGYYDSHIRDESSYNIGLKAAISEAIEVGRRAGMPTHISHIKALGVDVQGQAPAIIALVEAARRRGQNVTADQYPWSASGTGLAASLVPLWAQDGGRAVTVTRFDDPALADRLRRDMAENLRKRGGAEKLLITQGRYDGKTLAEIAVLRGTDAISAAMAVIRLDDPNVASFNQSEEDIAAFMRRPWVMTGSDASAGHPRVYGTFARKYAKYVVADRVVSLRDFIERSSALTADTFKLKDRGHLKRGAFADIVAFDSRTYAAQATYRQPTLFATGVKTVVVNGHVAIDEGKPTGVAAGRALPHKAKGRCT